MSPATMPPATTPTRIPMSKVSEFISSVLELDPANVISVHMMGGSITVQIYLPLDEQEITKALKDIKAKHPSMSVKGSSVSIETMLVFHVDPERT